MPGNRWLSPEEGAALKQRKEVVVRRLEELTGGLKPLQRQAILERKETHWDFLVKEMKWMAGDFENERKLHNKQRRKVCPCTHPFFVCVRARVYCVACDLCDRVSGGCVYPAIV